MNTLWSNIAFSIWVYLCHSEEWGSSYPAEEECKPLVEMDRRTNCPQEQGWKPQSILPLRHYQTPKRERWRWEYIKKNMFNDHQMNKKTRFMLIHTSNTHVMQNSHKPTSIKHTPKRLTLNPTLPLLQQRQVRSKRTKETSPEQEMRIIT